MTNQTTDIHAALQSVTDTFVSVFARGDAAALADFYSDDAMLMPAGVGIVKGKGDIVAYWQEAMDMGIKNARIDVIELEQHGDTAIELGQYTLSGADGQVIDQGKGVVIMKYQGGGWKIHRDIFNSSMAPQ